jgi:rRNA pseudouridine-1189 N-methylase Emg1 (Nep1/Mra1 family)
MFVRGARVGGFGRGQAQRTAVFVLEDKTIGGEPLSERLLAASVRDRAIAVAVENDDRHDAGA